MTEDCPPTSLVPRHQSSRIFTLRPGVLARLEDTAFRKFSSLSSTPQYRADNTILTARKNMKYCLSSILDGLFEQKTNEEANHLF